MRRLSLAATFLVLATAVAIAAQPPPLPPTAKKLTAAKIVALYDGKTFPFTTYTFFGAATGSVTYDFKTGTNHGTYQLGSIHGTFDGKIRMSGDEFCYQAQSDREHCDYVYVDGKTIYEADPSGKIESINQRP